MAPNKMRIAVAGLIAMIGIVLTHSWYIMTDPRRANTDAEAVAFVKKPIDEIHRKSADRFLWQLVEENEPLHNGDVVRTSSQGEVRIQFANSSKYIDLEPESSIVLQQSNGAITLDLLEGSLFVSGEQGGDNIFLMNAAGSKVDLTNAKAKISGSSKVGVDFNIIDGTAKAMKNGKTEKLTVGRSVSVTTTGNKNKNEALKVINPPPDGTIYINPEMPVPITFKWDPPAQALKVVLEIGSSRKSMKTAQTKPGKTNSELNIDLNAGKYFWKLKGYDSRNSLVTETAVNLLNVANRVPPIAVFPKAESKMIVLKPEDGMELRWTSENFNRIKVEVYSGGPNPKVVFFDNFPASSNSTVVRGLPFGDYAWKLYGQTDKGESMAGPMVPFKFTRKDPTRVNLAWSSEFSNTQRYLNNDPKISLKWTADKVGVVAKYKIKITPEDQPNGAMVYETKFGEFSQPLKSQGRYIASVEAFNKEDEIIGIMNPRTIEVAPVPPLKGLTILPNDTSKLIAKSDGSIQVYWRPLSGAKDYKVTLKNNSGQTIKEDIEDRDSYTFQSLLPGEYLVQLVPFDDFGRPGEPSRPRTISVPEKSQIKAPKLKAIKVK